MRKFLFLILCSISLFGLNAAPIIKTYSLPFSHNPIEPRKDGCDVLTKTDGEDIQVEILEIGTSEIKYKKCDNPTGPTYTIAKKDVFSIKYKNGTKEVFSIQKNSEPLEVGKPKKMEGFSIASFIFTLFILLGFYSLAAGIVMALLSLIFGVVGLNRIKKYPTIFGGRGFATFSIIIVVFGLVIVGIAAISYLP